MFLFGVGFSRVADFWGLRGRGFESWMGLGGRLKGGEK